MEQTAPMPLGNSRRPENYYLHHLYPTDEKLRRREDESLSHSGPCGTELPELSSYPLFGSLLQAFLKPKERWGRGERASELLRGSPADSSLALPPGVLRPSCFPADVS